MTSCLAGGNDANDLVWRCFDVGVDDDQQDQSFDRPDAGPSLLSRFCPLDECDAERIVEDQPGGLEIDAVLVEVALILLLILLEVQHLYVQISTYTYCWLPYCYLPGGALRLSFSKKFRRKVRPVGSLSLLVLSPTIAAIRLASGTDRSLKCRPCP